jgi:hypothetical protein
MSGGTNWVLYGPGGRRRRDDGGGGGGSGCCTAAGAAAAAQNKTAVTTKDITTGESRVHSPALLRGIEAVAG